MKVIRLVVVAGLWVPLAACATASAKAPPDRPTLEVPAPPAKVVEPMPRTEPVTPEPVAELPTTAPANVRPPRTTSREQTRSDPKPPETPAVETAPPPATPPAPAPQLRTPGTPDSAEAAKQVQAVIERATKSLNSVDVRRFTKAKRAVYDNARLMLSQAEDAFKKADFEIARNLAQKVETTAKELMGR